MGFMSALGGAFKAPGKTISKMPGVKPINQAVSKVPGMKPVMGATGFNPNARPQPQQGGVGPSPQVMQKMGPPPMQGGNFGSPQMQRFGQQAGQMIGMMQPGFQRPQLQPMPEQPPPMQAPAPTENPQEQEQAQQNMEAQRQLQIQQNMQQMARPQVMPYSDGEVPIQQMGGIGPRAPMMNQMMNRFPQMMRRPQFMGNNNPNMAMF